MSGFEYSIACGLCGLTSDGFPFQYDRVVAPEQAVLPAANRKRHCFEQVTIPVERTLPMGELVAIAAARSTEDVTVCVPSLSPDGAVLLPHVACPRCGNDALACPFGWPKPWRRTAQSTEQVVADARGSSAETIAFALPDRAATVEVTHDDAAAYRWHIAGAGRADIAHVVDELLAHLARAGSTTTGPKRRGGYTTFYEQRR
jgi:hypothetical protein